MVTAGQRSSWCSSWRRCSTLERRPSVADVGRSSSCGRRRGARRASSSSFSCVVVDVVAARGGAAVAVVVALADVARGRRRAVVARRRGRAVVAGGSRGCAVVRDALSRSRSSRGSRARRRRSRRRRARSARARRRGGGGPGRAARARAAGAQLGGAAGLLCGGVVEGMAGTLRPPLTAACALPESRLSAASAREPAVLDVRAACDQDVGGQRRREDAVAADAGRRVETGGQRGGSANGAR